MQIDHAGVKPNRGRPQSVTIIDRERIDDFALNNVNDLLDQMAGTNVERNETDRTEYDSRGFDITNFQVDGIGLPLRWGIQFGDLDTALFENVEVVRGANAIMTGVGNPSATINYVRKRPPLTRKPVGRARSRLLSAHCQDFTCITRSDEPPSMPSSTS